MKDEMALARRLGTTTHISPLRMKLERLSRRIPSAGALCTEDWLVDIANDRGARIVYRENRLANATVGVSESDLATEELVVGICQLQCLDRPQMLRLAAQLISRQSLNIQRLCLIAERESRHRSCRTCPPSTACNSAPRGLEYNRRSLLIGTRSPGLNSSLDATRRAHHEERAL